MATHENGVFEKRSNIAAEIEADLFAKLMERLNRKLRGGPRGENFSSVLGRQSMFLWRDKVFASICHVSRESEKAGSIVIHPNREHRELSVFADEEVFFPEAMKVRSEIFLHYIVPLEEAYLVAVSRTLQTMKMLVDRVPRPAGYINYMNGKARHIPIAYHA